MIKTFFFIVSEQSQKPLWCSGKATCLENQGSWVRSRASPVLRTRLNLGLRDSFPGQTSDKDILSQGCRLCCV